MKDIRTAQIAHKDVTGVYANNFDSLVKFIDEGIFTHRKRDSSIWNMTGPTELIC